MFPCPCPTYILHQCLNNKRVFAIHFEVPHPWVRLVVSGGKGRKRHILLCHHFWFLAICSYGAIPDLWGCISGEESPVLPDLDRHGDVPCFSVPPSLHCSVPIPRTGTSSTIPLSPGRCQGLCGPLRHPQHPQSAPGSFADPPGLCFLPHQPYFFPLCLGDQSSRVSTCTRLPREGGSAELGVVFCCESQSCHQQPL